MYHAGLSLKILPTCHVEPSGLMLGNGIDYYEALQVERRADTDTIPRIHLMAQRYHPDNLELATRNYSARL